MNSKLPWQTRLKATIGAASFYLRWYPKQLLPREWFAIPHSIPRILRQHLRYAARTARRLARAIFRAMLRRGPKLESEQILLGRFVDIGAELFAITSTCLRATASLKEGLTGNDGELCRLADYFCRVSKLRIEAAFHSARRNTDNAGYKVSRDILADKYLHLERGIVSGSIP
jgi:hypothetical protein